MKYKTTLIIWLLITAIFIVTYNQGLTISNRIQFGALYVWKGEIGEWWRVITYGFLHNSLSHFLGNIAIGLPLMLYVENRVGSILTLSIFLGGVILGGISYILFTTQFRTLTTGASAGIWALLAAAMIEIFSKPTINILVLIGLFVLTITLFRDTAISTNINKLGHVGGYIGGIIIIVTYLVIKHYKEKEMVYNES